VNSTFGELRFCQVAGANASGAESRSQKLRAGSALFEFHNQRRGLAYERAILSAGVDMNINGQYAGAPAELVSIIENEASGADSIIVEQHDRRDAGFCGRWLLKAAEADQVLEVLLRNKPRLRKSFPAGVDVAKLHPGYLATRVAARLMAGDGWLDLPQESWETSRGCWVLETLGFLDYRDELFSMKIPDVIDPKCLCMITLMLAEDYDACFGPSPVTRWVSTVGGCFPAS
jgi:hypothetical protein